MHTLANTSTKPIEFIIEFEFQVKIPCKPNDTLSDAQMTQFLQTLCQTCGSCMNLITLDPGPEQCDNCAEEERKELQREREEEEAKKRREHLKRTIKMESDSDSSYSDLRPLKFSMRNVKEEFEYFEGTADTVNASVSDIESNASNEDQEGNVSSTTVVAVTTNTTTTTTGSASFSLSGGNGAHSSNSSRQRPSTRPPNEWTVEDVISFISENDPALAVHAELFRKHVSLT